MLLTGAKRPTGIEPASSAWKAEVIAIIPQSHYVRDTRLIKKNCQQLSEKFFFSFLFFFSEPESKPMNGAGAIFSQCFIVLLSGITIISVETILGPFFMGHHHKSVPVVLCQYRSRHNFRNLAVTLDYGQIGRASCRERV